jgi:uncharacterized protein YndB with AHSA1/START domain
MSNRSLVAEPEQHSIVATSIFKAPREIVFKTMIDPELIPQWWGPRILTTVVDKMEPWSGGSWRYVVSNKNGDEWCFHGVYHTVEAPHSTVLTYEYEGDPGKVSMESTVYEDHEGGTKVTITSVFQSVEDRDEMMQSDMQDGADQTMDRLEELLEKVTVSS